MGKGNRINTSVLDEIEDFIMYYFELSYDKIADKIADEFNIILDGKHLCNWAKSKGIVKK